MIDLDVGNTELGLQSTIELSSAVMHNRSLNRLIMDNVRLPSLQEECATYLGQMVAQNTSLRELSLQKHQLRDHGVMVLTQYLPLNTTLVALSLRWYVCEPSPLPYPCALRRCASSVRVLPMCRRVHALS